MVPFTLRMLAAELPHHMGDTAATLDRLYALQAVCRAALDALPVRVRAACPWLRLTVRQTAAAAAADDSAVRAC
jgi:hypothetical protein